MFGPQEHSATACITIRVSNLAWSRFLPKIPILGKDFSDLTFTDFPILKTESENKLNKRNTSWLESTEKFKPHDGFFDGVPDRA